MINRLNVENFKGFERFSVQLRQSTYLSGPNSAGKSTLLAALRAASQMQKIALSRTADRTEKDLGDEIPVWACTGEQLRLNVENIRHEFRNENSSVHLHFSNGAVLKALWPKGEMVPSEGWFSFQAAGQMPLDRPAEIRREVPSLGFVPLLTPIEENERVLQPKTVRAAFDTRLSSRHFRNQLYLLDTADGEEGGSRFDDFRKFAEPWLPELQLVELATKIGRDGLYLDLYYREQDSGTLKEIYWIGDGMQIWLQLLLHLFRLSEETTIVLDEPDVYLHADLQRRLVRLLDTMKAQTITATHSPEVLAETDPSSVSWVSRNRQAAISGASHSQLGELSAEIGSQFNIRLARALKAKAVLFVEGTDVKILTKVARACGCRQFSHEIGLAVIPLNGFSNWEHVEPFAWFSNNLLGGTIPVTVVLDRDYRPPGAVEALLGRLEAAGVNGHVWLRKELESYLLPIPAIARASGAPEPWITERLDQASNALKGQVSARMLDERHRYEVGPRRHRVAITEDFDAKFSGLWEAAESGRYLCSAKDLISALNRDLAHDGHQTVSAHRLSETLRAEEVDSEMKELLNEIDAQLTRP
jgi:energy-coupling factor transporter ATP-binding protein EcfA2